MVDEKILIIINNLLILLLLFLISIYSLNMKKPYPKQIIELFNEAYIRFLCYLTIFLLSYYNIRLCMFLLFAVILLHIDYINLIV